ncbi:transporter [Bacillus endophyticus]|uniref:cation diffusion facilitator family transporter n=1 Tax=Priestia endophytica TaxID=135735 RepID=UPI001D5D0E05|nr:transporter [Priestia endophytica]MBG9813550.1 transporter [Priestia endophytica]
MDIVSAERGAWVSIYTYLILSTLKLFIGNIANSEALSADGLNNFTDIIASVAVLIGLKISKKPRDKNHPYGHSRAENISSLLASFIMMVIGFQVLYEAVQSLWHQEATTPNLLAALVGAGAAVVMFCVFLYNKRLADKLQSGALKAVAKDNLSDALVSVGAVVGIIGAYFGLSWLDPLAALVVGLIICKTAFEIFKETSLLLTDGFDEDKMGEYKEAVKAITGVNDVKDLRARMHGNDVVLDVTVTVNPELSVVRSHEIADEIEEELETKHQISMIHVHIEPDH